MTTITQAEILKRSDELHTKGLEAYEAGRKAYEATVGAEMRNLQETCGGIGHLLTKDRGSSWHTGTRVCVFCGTRVRVEDEA